MPFTQSDWELASDYTDDGAALEAQATAATAQSAASKAQETADTAKANAEDAKAAAGKAQTTADGAKADAATAKTQSSTAVSTANGAKTTANQAASTANSASSTANAAKSTVDGMQIGGRNLYTGTRDFSGNNWINKVYWTKEDETYNGFSVRSNSAIWNSLFQKVDAKSGDSFVLSGYFKAEAGSHIYAFGAIDQSSTSPHFKEIAGTSDDVTGWTRFSFKFEKLVDGLVQARIENGVDGKKLCVCGLKLERGTKATDWTPAPEDVDSAVADAKKAGTDAQTNLDDYKSTVVETYATKASLKVQEDRITTEVGAREKTDSTVADLSTKVDQTATSLSTEVAARQQTDANLSTLSTKVTQTETSITTEISDRKQAVSDAQAAAVSSANSATDAKLGSYTKTDDLANTAAVKDAKKAGTDAQATANATATMIRQYSGGVLVAKTGAAVGALVNASGSFDVVTLSWSDGVPTAGTELASFDGGRARIGNAAEAHVVIRPQSLVFYSDEAGNHLAEFTPDAVSVNDGSLKVKFGSGTIDGSRAAAIYGPTLGDGIILMPSESSNANLWICGDKAESGESAFAVTADRLMLASSGDALTSFSMDNVIKLLGSSWQSAEVTLNTSSSLLGVHSSSCYVNLGLGLAYLAIDMSFESPGWQPGTGTWVLRLPRALRPKATTRLSNIIQIYIGGRWGAHLDVHSDGYCYPAWGWQATNIMCATVFPLALLGL